MITSAPARHVHRIPVPRTPLIGRDREIADVLAILTGADTPLLTLTGPGGVGKTRVATQVARLAGEHFADGTIFVPLATARGGDGVLRAIAQAIGMHESRDEPMLDRIASELATMHVLLVLDNFEHLTASAPIIGDLLDALPSLTTLVTSQARLHLSVERVYPIAPLALPDAEPDTPLDRLAASDAIRLFVARAQAVQPGFTLTADNAGDVLAICRRLDGLPLAIELAAARSNAFSPRALHDRMRTSFLTSLAGCDTDRPERHQTIQATIAWSHDLLTPAEQRFLQCVSVFTGGFSLAAAEAVWVAMGNARDVAVDSLTSLVDKSLLRLVDDHGDEPRYTMLETIRAFALQRLGEAGLATSARRHHAAWCASLAGEADTGLQGADQAEWVERLTREHDNLRAALDWALDHDPEVALRTANALWLFWYVQGHLAEGQRWLERALAANETANVHLSAIGLHSLGNLVYEQGDLDRADALYHESLERYRQSGDAHGVANILNNLGMLANARGDHDRARALLLESLGVRDELDDDTGRAPTMNNLGDVAISLGDADTARHWNERALAIGRKLGNTRRIAHSLHNLGIAQRCRGDDAAATALFRHSLQLFEQVRDLAGVAIVLHSLGRAAARQGKREDAGAYYTRALALHRRVLDRRGLVVCLEGAAILAEAAGQAEQCVQLMSAASSLRGSMLPLQPPMDRDDAEAAVRRARSRLGESGFEAAWATGSTFTRDWTIEAAIAALEAPATTGPILTRREFEVLRLMARGRTNGEIADALFISVRTVKSHVTSIFAKLDVSTRAAAVAYAHNHDLV